MSDFRIFATLALLIMLWLLRDRAAWRALARGLSGRAGRLPMYRRLLQITLLAALVLLLSGLARPMTGGTMSGYWLIAHLLAAPVFAVVFLKMVFFTAAQHQTAEDETALVRAVVLQNRRDLRVLFTPALRLRLLYWLAVSLATLAMATAGLRLFAFGDTATQVWLAGWHRYAAVLFFLAAAGYLRRAVKE